MRQLKNLTGQKFGKLTVLQRLDNVKSKPRWLCQCECGKIIAVFGENLRSKRTKSCGCLRIENGKRIIKTHGLSHTRLYRIWNGMKNRCYNSKRLEYKNYGGRGITICSEWKTEFKAFYDWAMKNGYSDNLSIDRIDNDKGYSPDNCRWVTFEEQVINKRNNVFITINEISKTVSEWSKLSGVKYTTLKYRNESGVDNVKLLRKV